MKTRFSVVIPTFNRRELIGPTIDSVLAQTFADYEIVVVDDGSTDGTPEVLRAYGSKIRVIRQENQGPEVARDRGIREAAGEYIALLDSDDLWLPQALATYDRIINSCQSPALILGATCYFSNNQVPELRNAQPVGIEVWQYDDYLAKQVSVGLYGSNVVARKSVIEQAGGLRHSTPTTFYMDLLDTMLRIGVYGPCVVVKQPVTVAYRVHATNSIRNIEAMANSVFPIIEAERRGQYPGGRARRFARYACIGGVAWCWFKYALAARRLPIVGKYMIYCTPMFVAGAWKKVWVRVRRGQLPPVRVS
ncbi:MAG TPA: glycosyltransferase family A protein [Verrucomicrobiae bacterium]|nr:glycosyltransferase family A protein [Verrucomicrobiae bacterium]